MKFQSFAIVAALAVSGCMGSGEVAMDRVVTDVQRDGVTITGRYDPRGFSSAEVQRLVGNLCRQPGINGYSESPIDGQIAFQFTCVHGNDYGASAGVNFTRTGNNSARYSALFSVDGNIVTASGDVRF
jgi:hypothetical protein